LSSSHRFDYIYIPFSSFFFTPGLPAAAGSVSVESSPAMMSSRITPAWRLGPDDDAPAAGHNAAAQMQTMAIATSAIVPSVAYW